MRFSDTTTTTMTQYKVKTTKHRQNTNSC